MQISSEKRKEILLNSFDILKDDYEKNSGSFAEIIAKMFKLDSNLAVEMWVYLLKKHQQYVKSDAYRLTEGVIYQAESSIGKPGIAEVVAFNGFLKEVVFGKSESISYNCADIVAYFLNTKQLFVANELLELFKKNKANREMPLSNFLIEIIERVEEDVVTEELYNFFQEWVGVVPDDTGKATINVKLLNLF